MTHVILVAHAPLATALLAVARHVYPDCSADVDAIDVEATQSVEATEQRLREAMHGREDGETLILVDAFGASPCNAALKVCDGVRVRAVAGVNVPMLWRTLCYRGDSLDSLVARAMSGATQGVMHVLGSRVQNQGQPVSQTIDDQVQHSHQQ